MVEKQKSTSFMNETSASKQSKDKKTDKKQITSFFSAKDQKAQNAADDKSGTESNKSSLAPKKERKVTPRKLVKNSKGATKDNNQTLNPEEKNAKSDDVANGGDVSKPKGRGRPKKNQPDSKPVVAASKVSTTSAKDGQASKQDESMVNEDHNQEEQKQEDQPMEEEDEDFNMDEVEVEQASDDDVDSQEEDFEGTRSHATRGAKKRKRALDDESDEDQTTPFNMNDQFAMDMPDESDEPEESSVAETKQSKRKKKAAQKKADKAKKAQIDASAEEVKVDESKLQEEDEDEDVQYIDNLPTNETDLKQMLGDVRRCIKKLEKQFFEEEDSDQERDLMDAETDEQRDAKFLALQQSSHIKQFWCVPLSDDVLALDVDKMVEKQKQMTGGRLFDIITADPPWQLSTANPTRGVAIAYDSMSDTKILDIPFEKLQTDGFLFIWVINAKYRFALRLFDKFGYKLVDELTWCKQTVNGKIAKGHGYYLQHAKETCLVGVKGDVANIANFNIESDVIFSQRRGQSQKPEEIYEIAESLVPNGYYLEIFGRRNNLHNGWVTIGNEL